MSIARDLPSLVTDSQAVEQVVMNMLINAGQAADKSDSWVRLKVDRIDDSQYVAAIEIADNGCGIDDETRKHIFDPLFTTKGPNKGTGLGLYICHNLAEGIGGHITVHSVPGEGSTFRLMLPDLRNKRRPERLLTRAATRLDPHVEKAN